MDLLITYHLALLVDVMAVENKSDFSIIENDIFYSV